MIKKKQMNKDALLAQQREMNTYYEKYRQLVEAGKLDEASIYYQKTLDSANRLVHNGQKILQDILDKQAEEQDPAGPGLRGFHGVKTENGMVFIQHKPKDEDDVVN